MGRDTTRGVRATARTPRVALAAAVLAVAAGWWPGGPAAPARAASGAVRVAPEVPVTAMDETLGTASNSPSLLADPNDGRFVVAANRLDAPDFGCALQVSGDGGRSWRPATPVPALPQGVEKCYAPEVAFDGRGVLHYLFVGLAGPGNEPVGAFLTTSPDRAQSFSAPLRVLGPGKFGVRMAVDPRRGPAGRLHLVWLDTASDPPLGGFGPPPNPILAAHSDDGGRTLSSPVQVSDRRRLRVVAPALALGPDGTAFVSYYDLGDDARDYQGLEGPVWEGTWSLVVHRSLDGGARFTTGRVVDDAIAPAERVMLVFTMPPAALVAGREHVCAAWPDARRGDADVLARCSDDAGGRWGRLRRVNDDAPGNGRAQYLPRLGLSPEGRLDAVFYDRRADPANLRNEVFYTYSTDGGRTFAPNVRLTRDPSDTRIGQRYAVPSAEGKVEWGSRLALLSGEGRALAAWADTRNSSPRPVEEGDLLTGQDVFATTVTTPAEPQPARWWPVLLVAGAAAATVALLGRRRRRRAPAAPVALALLVGACSPDGADRVAGRVEAPLPPPPPVVEVTLEEYRFAYRAPVSAGRTVFVVRNAGRVDHELRLFPLDEDFPPIDEQLRGTERRLLRRFGGTAPRQPGTTGTFAVDLAAGRRYALICFLTAGAGGPHALRGMNAEFVVPLPPGHPAPGP